jgi:hypothetical protein
MDKNLENVSDICKKERIDMTTIPQRHQGAFFKIIEGVYKGENQNFTMGEEKIFIVEIGKNIVYRLSFTKNKIDIFCSTEEPTIKQEIIDSVAKELTLLLKKKRMEEIY